MKAIALERNRGFRCCKCNAVLTGTTVITLSDGINVVRAGKSCAEKISGFVHSDTPNLSRLPLYYLENGTHVQGFRKFASENKLKSEIRDSVKEKLALEYFALRCLLLTLPKYAELKQKDHYVSLWMQHRTREFLPGVFNIMIGAEEKFQKVALPHLRAFYAMNFWIDYVKDYFDQKNSDFLCGLSSKLTHSLFLNAKQIQGLNGWLSNIKESDFKIKTSPFLYIE